MKFIDLNKEFEFYKEAIFNRWKDVHSDSKYFFGRQTLILEFKLQHLINRKYCIAVGNGTEALYLALKRVYKSEMPIILPNFGAYPTAVVCRNITDNLFYVDVDSSFTIDVNKLPDIKNGIIVPVNLFGNNCNIDKIKEYAEANNHIIVEDCAQSAGSSSEQISDYSIFSFYPTKPLSSMGDGGAICFNEFEDNQYFKCARFYGQDINKKVVQFGINSRIDEFQAAVVNAKFDTFKNFNGARISIANQYKQVVKGIKINSYCIYHQFPVLFKDRNLIIRKLREKQIPYLIHYKYHSNEVDYLKGKNPSKVEYRVNDKIISLPIHQYLKNDEIEKIMDFLYENRSQEV